MRNAATVPCIALEPDRISAEVQSFEMELRRRIVGQEHAVKSLAAAFQSVRAGLSPERRPIRNLLFLGPTGSGKTRSVEAVAEVLFGNPNAVVKIDCGEFQHSHEIAKLIGSPPGYLGHRETPAMLTQARLDQFHTTDLKLTLVLFDEVEKANEAVWQLLLGILDKGILTLGDNQQVDFSRTIIFMTSNLGAAEMQHAVEDSIGFAPRSRNIAEGLTNIALNAARKRFSPEFLNRLDEILVFDPLSKSQLRQVLAVEIEKVESRLNLAAGREIKLRLSDQAAEFLLQEGTDCRYGARHLKRAIERWLIFPFSSLIATGQMESAATLNIGFDARQRKLTFCKQASPSL
ncbi:MAG: ATP-dependent Clp protease ATP-binding subunit [Acidobacteria bacterium]|nr:ATP-dependent Clp protease ATP-binding subunit [Acidobacteriota bacterium]